MEGWGNCGGLLAAQRLELLGLPQFHQLRPSRGAGLPPPYCHLLMRWLPAAECRRVPDRVHHDRWLARDSLDCAHSHWWPPPHCCMRPSGWHAVVCSWHRTLLALGALLNCGAPCLRYWAALHGSYHGVVATNLMQGAAGCRLTALSAMCVAGAAFGVIGAWPPMLALLLGPSLGSDNKTAITAVCGLSNCATRRLCTECCQLCHPPRYNR